jgi:sugar transferase (PEP-CTERM/EpsH1 system associated)
MKNHETSPLIVHIIQRLAIGGMENGLVNLINHMAHYRYRHAIICITEATDFKKRIENRAIPVIDLKHFNSRDPRIHIQIWKALRSLDADIVHTRNLPTLEFQWTAALAGVHGRIHGEHGRDMYDLDGKNVKYNLLRQAVRPFVGRYITVSLDLEQWLLSTVGARRDRVTQIYNGVDIDKFRPRSAIRTYPGPASIFGATSFVVGTVGRMEEVKDPLNLVRAFLQIIQSNRKAHKRLRLVMIGDGSLRRAAWELLRTAHAEHFAWLPGDRDDVSDLLKSMDLFVLPSLREGISNTVLEAMATGLPVIATNVGGNPELVDNNTGMLIPHSDSAATAGAIQTYLDDPGKVSSQGRAGRERVGQLFSMDKMVAGYLNTYDLVLRK